jgi:hypothetical protein
LPLIRSNSDYFYDRECGNNMPTYRTRLRMDSLVHSFVYTLCTHKKVDHCATICRFHIHIDSNVRIAVLCKNLRARTCVEIVKSLIFTTEYVLTAMGEHAPELRIRRELHIQISLKLPSFPPQILPPCVYLLHVSSRIPK